MTNEELDKLEAALARINDCIVGYDNRAQEERYCCFFTKEEYETIRAALSSQSVPQEVFERMYYVLERTSHFKKNYTQNEMEREALALAKPYVKGDKK